MRKSEVGELRPSQVLHTFGIGAIVDLPNLSVMVMGLEDWPIFDPACSGPVIVSLIVSEPAADDRVGTGADFGRVGGQSPSTERLPPRGSPVSRG